MEEEEKENGTRTCTNHLRSGEDEKEMRTFCDGVKMELGRGMSLGFFEHGL